MNIINFSIKIFSIEFHSHLSLFKKSDSGFNIIDSISIFIKLDKKKSYNNYTYGIHFEYYGWGIYYGRKEYFKWNKYYELLHKEEQLNCPACNTLLVYNPHELEEPTIKCYNCKADIRLIG